MNQTLSCLAIPNLTACSTSRPHRTRGPGTALCVKPTPHLTTHSQHMPLKTDLRCRLFHLFCAYLKWQKCLPVLFNFHHFISEAHLLTKLRYPSLFSLCKGTLNSILWIVIWYSSHRERTGANWWLTFLKGNVLQRNKGFCKCLSFVFYCVCGRSIKILSKRSNFTI